MTGRRMYMTWTSHYRSACGESPLVSADEAWWKLPIEDRAAWLALAADVSSSRKEGGTDGRG